MLARVAIFVAAFSFGYRTPFWKTACASLLLWSVRHIIAKAVEQSEVRSQMRFVAEQQLTALQNENEALRNACDSTSARLVYAHDQINKLEHQLRAAASRALKAEAGLEEARKSTGARALTDQEQLYGRLGLTPKIPSAFIPHIRRAVLLTLHPDRHVSGRKAAAERRFVEAMAIVDKIYSERNL